MTEFLLKLGDAKTNAKAQRLKPSSEEGSEESD